jgi:hypothetical protein
MGTPTTTCDRKRDTQGSSGPGKDTGSPLKSSTNPNASYVNALGNLDLQYSSITTQLPASHADWSFDPWEESIPMFTNRELVDAILFTEDWFAAHGIIELDYDAYKVREKRLETERQARIAMGHLWLRSVHDRRSTKLYQTVEGANGGFDVVVLESDELVYGPVRDVSDRPIMTASQFQASLKAIGVPTISLEDYQAQMAASQSPALPFEFADAGVPSTSSLPIYGVSGAVSISNARANMLQDAFSLRNPAARQGAIGEAYLGSSREAGYGAFMRDYNKVDWTHPRRGVERGNYPLVDFQKWALGGPRPEWSAKTRSVVNANPFTQYDTYLTGMAQMLNTEPGYRGFQHYMNNAGRGRTPQQVRDQLSLRINADDVASFRQFISDPFRKETTKGGKQSKDPNYRRAAMSRIYNGILQDRPFTLNGQSYNTVEALDAALNSKALTVAQHRQALIDVGQSASAKVGEIPDLTGDVLTRFNAARTGVPNLSARDVRRVVSPELMFSLSRGGGWRGDLAAGRSYGFKGAGLGAGFGIAHELYSMATDDVDNPDAFYRLATAGGREGLRGGLTSGAESVIASRTSRYLLQRGLSATSGQALALGFGKRAVPGLVDVGFETYNVATESRSHRPREVGYRLTRAFVIGGSSAWAGAAAGAAIGSVVPVAGTIIGFVVGLIVGALVGFIMNSIIPNYEQMVMEQVPLKEFEKNIDQQSAAALQGQAMARDEMRLMQQVVSGPEWRGPHNMREMYMQRNLSHLPGDRMYMESMIAGDIRSGCGECHARKAGSEWNAMFEPGNPALMAPVDRMYLAALENEMSGDSRGKFLDWEVQGDTVNPAIAQMLADDPTAVSIINSVNAIQPNFREWEDILGPKGQGLVPRGAMNSPKGAEAFKGAIKDNIDFEQWYFELFFGEVGEAEYKIYRDNVKKAEEEQKKKNAK